MDESHAERDAAASGTPDDATRRGAAPRESARRPDDDASLRAAQRAAEDALIARVQRGDATAFDALVRLHTRRAYQLAYRVLGSREDAEDLVQEAFMTALDHIATFERGRPFSPWLSRIVLTRALNARKAHARRRVQPLNEEAMATTPSPLAAVASNDTRERVRSALARLPERQRVIIQLFELDGYGAKEVAEMLGLSAGTVRWHAHEARRALRGMLDSVFRDSPASASSTGEIDGETDAPRGAAEGD